jgi:serine protease AprX
MADDEQNDDAFDFRKRLGRFTVPPFIQDPQARNDKWGLPVSDDEPGDYIVELNLAYTGGLEQAGVKFRQLFANVMKDQAIQRPPVLISKSYYKCSISARELRNMVAADENEADARERIIYKVWPDFPVRALIDQSRATVKADAAIRAFEATGRGIAWGVVDSGIEGTHVHFGPGSDGKGKNTFCNTLFDRSVATLHRDFTAPPLPDPGAPGYQTALDANIAGALTDGYGHGTHVAGIIAGGLADSLTADDYKVCERVFKSDPSGQSHSITIGSRPVESGMLRGVAPDCKLVSLKVLGNNGRGSTSSVMIALRYIREQLNDDPKLLRIHGVNLSLGYEFDAEMFACGQSPLCVEVDRLVKSGVVVVTAAGNTGYAPVNTLAGSTKIAMSNTINDPGNASLAITVGSSHRDAPHTYGVSYFSSKGPTADGRLKPDLVAPGERITSAATAGQLKRLGLPPEAAGANSYIDDSGTSMAAPHVSGAIAAFLSIRREFIQHPEDVKKIFLNTATSLGRERYFEGRGLVDLMRAIQSV